MSWNQNTYRWGFCTNCSHVTKIGILETNTNNPDVTPASDHWNTEVAPPSDEKGKCQVSAHVLLGTFPPQLHLTLFSSVVPVKHADVTVDFKRSKTRSWSSRSWSTQTTKWQSQITPTTSWSVAAATTETAYGCTTVTQVGCGRNSSNTIIN